MAVLAEGNAASRIPVQDLRRARSLYAEKLGLEPVEERPGGLRYQCGNGEFALFESAGATVARIIRVHQVVRTLPRGPTRTP
jgi:hypothetical protein